MAKNYANIAKEVLRLVGGDKNVSHFEHCSTRLRFSIVDPGKVDQAGLKKVPGVMGVVGQRQSVSGGHRQRCHRGLRRGP